MVGAFLKAASPTVLLMAVTAKLMEAAFFDTVTVQVADLPPALAVMVAVPSATACTIPAPSTVATDRSLDSQSTSALVALAGVTVAVS